MLNQSSVSWPWRTVLSAARRAVIWLPSCVGRSAAPASLCELVELPADTRSDSTTKYA